MFENVVMGIAKEAVFLTLLISLPILGGSLVVGLVISILQATTQIQEQTLTFIPKIVVVLLIFVIFGPWMFNLMSGFTQNLFMSIPQLVNYR